MARYNDVLQIPVSKEVRAQIEKLAGDQTIAAFVRKELLGPFLTHAEPVPEFESIQQMREWLIQKGYTQVDRLLHLIRANYHLFEGNKQ